MAAKMHSAVVEQFRKPVELQGLHTPSPGAGEILVKTEACGVCHTGHRTPAQIVEHMHTPLVL